MELLINLGGLLKLLLISKLGVTFNSEDSLHFVEAILCESVKLSGLLGVWGVGWDGDISMKSSLELIWKLTVLLFSILSIIERFRDAMLSDSSCSMLEVDCYKFFQKRLDTVLVHV